MDILCVVVLRSNLTCPHPLVVQVVGHVVPEAQVGGPIALVQDGDVIVIDAEKNTLDMEVSEEEIERRRKEWKAPPLKVTQGTLYKYVKAVSDASHGCGEYRAIIFVLKLPPSWIHEFFPLLTGWYHLDVYLSIW